MDLIFILPNKEDDELQKIYNSYAGIFEHYATFKLVYESITKFGGCCMMIDNAKHSNKIDDVVYWTPLSED